MYRLAWDRPGRTVRGHKATQGLQRAVPTPSARSQHTHIQHIKDDTLWYPELYMLDGAPFQKDPATGHVTDRRKTRIYLHDGAVKVLNALRTLPQFEHAHVASGRNTRSGRTCLGLLDVAPGVSAADAVSDRRLWQIFPSNKRRHFDRIHQALGDVPYESMIFFDNERSN